MRRGIILLAIAAIACFGDISGTVYSSLKKPCGNAYIHIVNSVDSTKQADAFADSLGRYSLPLPEAGSIIPASILNEGRGLEVFQNFPNPFSKRTTIGLITNKSGPADLIICNMQGHIIKNHHRYLQAGYSTMLLNFAPEALEDGIYVYIVSFSGQARTGKMIVSTSARQSVQSPDGRTPLRKSAHPAGISAGNSYQISIYGKNIYPINLQNVALNDGDTKDFEAEYKTLWDSSRCILRSALSNSRYQFEKNGQGRVAFLGGSITYNPGWRTNIMDSLKSRFPQTTFDFINAGLPSCGSNIHAFRLQKDVFYKGKVDLLFIESAVNDTLNAVQSTERARATEGIIRQALANNPDIDIVMLYFADDFFYPYVQAGQPIPCIVDYEKSGWYYGVSSANLAQYIAEHYTWQEFGGDVHPGTLGTEIYTKMIQRLLSAAWDDSGSLQRRENFYLPFRMMDSFSYSKGHCDSLAIAVLSGRWHYVPSWHPADTVETREGFVNVPALVDTAPGDTLTFRFTGTAVGIVFPAGQDVGMLDYYIDARFMGTRDQFTPSSALVHVPWQITFAADLERREHELMLVTSHEKNTASKGYACRIMRFAVNGP